MTHEFDQSLEPADLLQFQSGSAGFKLDKKTSFKSLGHCCLKFLHAKGHKGAVVREPVPEAEL